MIAIHTYLALVAGATLALYIVGHRGITADVARLAAARRPVAGGNWRKAA